MSWCSIANIRESDNKLTSETDVPDSVITSRIASAQEKITVDLSPIISEADLATIGDTSTIIKTLCIYKATELSLVYYYGAFRQGEETSDIMYWMNQYKEMIDSILSGEIELLVGGLITAKNFPGLSTSSNARFYKRKGVEGFVPDGGTVDTVDN